MHQQCRVWRQKGSHARLPLVLVLRELRLRLLDRLRLLLWLLLPPLLLLLPGLAVAAPPRGGLLLRLSFSAFTPGSKLGRLCAPVRSALTSGMRSAGAASCAFAGSALTSRCDLGSQASSWAADAAGKAAGCPDAWLEGTPGGSMPACAGLKPLKMTTTAENSMTDA